MEDPFILKVNYKGEDRDFNAVLLLQGFTHKIKVQAGETEIFFEPDEEGGYRAVKMPWQEQKELDKTDRHLIALIRQKIQEVLK